MCVLFWGSYFFFFYVFFFLWFGGLGIKLSGFCPIFLEGFLWLVGGWWLKGLRLFFLG